jgi:hypothetical protein
MRMTKHLVTTVVMLATVITITFPISAPAQGTSLMTYRNADLGYAIDYPSGWEASDAFGILEIDSPKESLVATLQVISLADDIGLGEFSDGRVQNVEAETRNVDMAVYEDTEFGGIDAQGIKYKMDGKTVYVIWTIEDDKAYVLTINIKNNDMTSTLLNQANQIKDSFRLHTDRVTSVNSESSDDDDDDDNSNNDNGNGRDIIVEEEKTVSKIDNAIKNTVTGRDTDSNKDLDTDTDTDSDTDTDTDSDKVEKAPFEIDNAIKNTVTSRDTGSDKDTDLDKDANSDKDTDTRSGKDTDVDCDQRQDFVEVLGMCKDSEKVDGETETEESSDNGKNNNDNGNKHGKDNGNKHGKDNGNKHGK